MSVPLCDRSRVGLPYGVRVPMRVVAGDVRATRGAVCRLLETPGATVEAQQPDGSLVPVLSAASVAPTNRYRVTVTTHAPHGITAVLIGDDLALRLDCDLPFTGEIPDYDVDMAWTPCPHCGARLVDCSEVHGPYYRVCSRAPHHHWTAA